MNMTNSSGWVCPKCGNVYAPCMMECKNCNDNKLPKWPSSFPNVPNVKPEFTPGGITVPWCSVCSRSYSGSHVCQATYTLKNSNEIKESLWID